MNEAVEKGARVRVFGTTYCGFCRSAEALLTREGIPFEKIDVTGDDRARAALVEAAGGRRTVPVIFVDGRVIGGYEELVRYLATQAHPAVAPAQDQPPSPSLTTNPASPSTKT